MTADQPTTLHREIGEAIATLHGHYYKHGPSSYIAHVMPETVVVVLEETFTPAELTLIEHGKAEHVAETRRNFQKIVEDEFVSIVEQATGQKVRAFISDVHLEARVSIEVFLLGDVKMNMTAFETEMDRPESGQAQHEREERES